MKLISLPLLLLLLSYARGRKGGGGGGGGRRGGREECTCGVFLLPPTHVSLPWGAWGAGELVFLTGRRYQVDCSDVLGAEEECRRRCEEEVLSINEIFTKEPHLLLDYPPPSTLPCPGPPSNTSSFFSACPGRRGGRGGGRGRGEEWKPSSSHLASAVCCDPETNTPVWCSSVAGGGGAGEGAEGRARLGAPPIQRKIDTSVDPNSLEANSIEGSSSSSSSSSSSTQDDWLTGALKFFGYENFGQFVKEIDIFTLPTRIQKAMKTYRDELSMGQCYMEFTTYTLFSKPDNFFTNFMRNKRSLPEEEELWEARVIGGSGGGGGGDGGGSAFERLAQGFISMLDSSPTTRQYASLLKQVLPVVVQMTAAQDSGSAVTTFVKHALGSYLSDIQSPTKTTNGIEKIDKPTDKWPSSSSSSSSSSPPSSSSSSSSSSPLSDIILGGFKYYMSNYLSSLPGNGAPPQPTPTPTTPRPTSVHPRPPQRRPPSTSSLNSLLSLIMGSAPPQNIRRPPKQPPPPPKTRPPTPKPEEKEESKNFIEMILEFIRPVFISIIGKSPGESGVESIREVTRLSRLGRVDDILAEEVLSPYFCLKNYMVNKIWTLTERGVRSVVGRFDPSEQARMMVMWG